MKSKGLLVIGIIITILIWLNSTLPANLSSNQSGLIVNVVYPLFKGIVDINTFSTIIRKLAHLTEFMILAVIFSYYFKSVNINKYYLPTLTYGLIVAIIDEIIQRFIPGRAGLITDVLIDLLGVIIGIIVVNIITRLRFKHINNE